MRIRKKPLYALAPAALLLMLLVVGVNCAGCVAMRRSEATTARDPQTRIIRGAEPVRIARGRKGACLLLHGWITTPADFGELPQALDEAGWDVHAPLHAGHGTTPRDLRGITAQKLLDAAREHYDALRASHDRVVLVGFSMGGTIATLLAAERPPDRLVLIAPFCGVRYKWYYVLPPRWWSAVLSPVIRYVPRPPGTIYCNRKEGREAIITYDAFPTDASRALFRLRSTLLEDAQLANLTMPALLVYSSGDDTCSPKAMAALLERLPADPKRAAAFARSNHHLLHDHDREQAIRAIVEFVGKP